MDSLECILEPQLFPLKRLSFELFLRKYRHHQVLKFFNLNYCGKWKNFKYFFFFFFFFCVAFLSKSNEKYFEKWFAAIRASRHFLRCCKVTWNFFVHHWDLMLRFTCISLNTGNCGPEKLRIWTLHAAHSFFSV